jgi:AraC-like DNA-binding protein
VHFAHSKPVNLEPYREAFRTTLLFDRREAGLVLETGILVAPIPSADPVLKRLLQAYAQDLLDAAHPRVSTSQRVRDVLVELLPTGFPSRAQVAERLGVSDRTLARVLEAENATYTSLVDELRIELAFRRLQEGRMAIGGVAAELGFQDQSAFTKFFKRRAGVLPLEYRRQYRFREAGVA